MSQFVTILYETIHETILHVDANLMMSIYGKGGDITVGKEKENEEEENKVEDDRVQGRWRHCRADLGKIEGLVRRHTALLAGVVT